MPKTCSAKEAKNMIKVRATLFSSIAVAAALLAGCVSPKQSPLLVGISDTCSKTKNSVPDYYAESLKLAGHIPAVICKNNDTNALRAIVKKLDLIIFTGGEDINPQRYGKAKSRLCEEINNERDEFDFALMAACLAENKPMLGICRGSQLMNVFFGGTLYQDIPSEYKVPTAAKQCLHRLYPYYGGATNPPLHKIFIERNSRLASVIGVSPLKVNSHHHQGVDQLAPGFKITARAEDGFAEVFEHQSYPAIGIQFHPENTVACKPQTGFDIERQTKIFLEIAKLTGSSKKASSNKTPKKD